MVFEEHVDQANNLLIAAQAEIQHAKRSSKSGDRMIYLNNLTKAISFAKNAIAELDKAVKES